MARKTARDDELSRRPAIKKELLKLFADVEQGYADQRSRADDTLDLWDMYNCILGEKQFYNGNSKIFAPIVRSAVNARKTRFVNQIFPQNGRNVECTTVDGDVPHATIALIEHYIAAARLRTQVMPALMVSGDVEGQYSVYVDWQTIKRHTVSRETKGVMIDGLEHPEIGEHDEIVAETIEEGGPSVEILADSDMLVLPAVSDSIDEALENGGTVTIIRRWSKAQIKRKIKDGDIDATAGETLLDSMNRRGGSERRDPKKEQADAAGIKTGSGGKFALIYETWTKLKVDGDMRLCRAYYGGDDLIIGCKLNPYWCDLCPIVSAPVNKVAGVFKGMSLVQPGVADLQILANDAVNQGADNLSYSLNPVTLVDPEKVSRWESLVLDLGAVWPVPPGSAQILGFPNVSDQAVATVAMAKNEIFQALSVNPAMVPQGTGGKSKRNQAEIANEQQVDVLTTSDAVTTVEEGILTQIVQRMMWYDHQFRTEDIQVRSFGEMGMRAIMERIPPIQVNNRWTLRWFGVEAARNAAQIQQQIAMANVIKGIPPQMYPGYKLNMAPLLVQLAESTFGPRLAPLTLTSMKDQLSVEPEVENNMLQEGFSVQVHPGDDDPKHMQAHMAVLQMGDPTGNVRVHMEQHQQQMQAKAAMQQQSEQGTPGGPGGAGSGVAGTPKPGSQPAPPRQMKGPAGMIHPDQMSAAGASGMPRKM